MKMKDRYVYFLYSSKQYADKRAIEKRRSKEYIPGKVRTPGGFKQYTEISSKSTNNYADSIVVHKGMLSEIKYTKPN